jgi:hypothetical protein
MKRLQLIFSILGLFFLTTITSASVLDKPNPTNTPLVIAPTITQCPSNLTLNLSNACNAVMPNMLGSFRATDNCVTPTTLTYTQSPVAGTVLTGGHDAVHNVTFTVTDNCGESATCRATVTLKDVRRPTILAHNRIVELASGQATITINDVLNVVQDNCTPSNLITLQLSRTTFTCVDLLTSPVSIQLSATDAAGNTDFVNVNIDVQDNMNSCTIVPLTGKIKTESGAGISNVQVVLRYLGTPITTLTTDATGNYSLNVVENTNFTIEMKKITNPLNGVTTADATAISNHIATTPILITSPYKLMAANVSEADSDASFVDIADNVRILKAIDPIAPMPLPVSSWAFIPANHTFTTLPPAYPTPQKLQPFSINIAVTTANYDFIGVKKGDVDGDADPNQ